MPKYSGEWRKLLWRAMLLVTVLFVVAGVIANPRIAELEFVNYLQLSLGLLGLLIIVKSFIFGEDIATGFGGLGPEHRFLRLMMFLVAIGLLVLFMVALFVGE